MPWLPGSRSKTTPVATPQTKVSVSPVIDFEFIGSRYFILRSVSVTAFPILAELGDRFLAGCAGQSHAGDACLIEFRACRQLSQRFGSSNRLERCQIHRRLAAGGFSFVGRRQGASATLVRQYKLNAPANGSSPCFLRISRRIRPRSIFCVWIHSLPR